MADPHSIADMALPPRSGEAPHRVIILLHGRGADGHAMLEQGQCLRRIMPEAEILLPTAPLPMPGPPGRFQWFDEDLDDEEAMTASVARSARMLNCYVDQIKAARNLSADRIALAGYSQGAMVALYAAPRRAEPVGCVVSFAGLLFGRLSLKAEGQSNCPVLLLHGGEDDVVPPVAALEAKRLLEEQGNPVESLILPGIGHTDIIRRDGPAMAAALRYLRRHGGAAETPPPVTEAASPSVPSKIKLVVWDLDDTLWRGTLAEQDEVVPHPHRVHLVRELNRHGIVSAICSKNDPEIARRKLEELGLWDQFVFPRIDFAPKGPVLAEMIADMRLRPANVLFVDDNVHNLEEATFLLPEIRVLDANSPHCDAILDAILDDNRQVEKSRLEEYRALEHKHDDRVRSAGSREDFLRSCGIHLAVASRADIMDFAPRIEELINRTNQLNFTKSRVAEGSMAAYLSDVAFNEGLAVFVWDKYGYHGLVGFASVHMPSMRLKHMTFSCRIMDMGIENWVADRLLRQFPQLRPRLPAAVSPHAGDWITVDSFDDPRIRTFILEQEEAAPRLRAEIVGFNLACQSGSLAHFSGLREVSLIGNTLELPNQPCRVENSRNLGVATAAYGAHGHKDYPPLLVFGMAADLWNAVWPLDLVGEIEYGLYERCVGDLCREAAARGSRILVIRPPRELPSSHYLPQDGITPERHRHYAEVWSQATARTPDEVHLLDVDDFGDASGCIDIGHYKVPMLKTIGEHVRSWVLRQCPHLSREHARILLELTGDGKTAATAA